MAKSISVLLSLKDKFTNPIKKVAEQTGRTEKEIKKASNTIKKFQRQAVESFKKISMAGAAMGAATAATVGALAAKTAATGDRIDKMSQKLNLSRKGFQEWEFVISQSGGNIEQLKEGMNTFSTKLKAVNDHNKQAMSTFRKLGVSIKNNNGTVKSQEQLFNETVIALQKMPEGFEKSAIANELLGGAGRELLPLLNSQSASIEELKKKANDLGLVLSDDAVNASVVFTDTMDTLKRSLGAVVSQLGAKLLPVVTDVAQKIIDNMPKIKAVAFGTFDAIAGAIKFLTDNMNWLIPVAGSVLSSILAYNAINGVITVITALKNVIAAVNTVQGIWNALMLANPIGLIAVGVGVLVGAIALLVMNWDKVTAAVSKAFNAMKKAANLIPGVNLKTTTETVKRNALGTSYFSGGATSINEGGRSEVVNLPSGSQIIPHNEVKKAANGSGIPPISVIIQGNVIGNQEFIDKLGQAVFGKVEAALANV